MLQLTEECPEGMPLVAEWSSRWDAFGKCGGLDAWEFSNEKPLYREVSVGQLKLRKMFFAYVLRSRIKGIHYYGHSKNLESRLKNHNSGRVRSTKAYRPWELIYLEEFETKSEAYQREMFFKSINGYNYLKEKGIT